MKWIDLERWQFILYILLTGPIQEGVPRPAGEI